MTDDPRQPDGGAPDTSSAGEQTYGRAELLGTTARTALVRCPCGRRQDFDREDWRWYGVARCAHCGRGILYDSLLVVSARRARQLIRERRPTERELRALRRMELAQRHFMLSYGAQPRWVWSPAAHRLADEAGPALSELDASRRGRGAPPVVAAAPQGLDEAAGEQATWVEGRRGGGAGDEVFIDDDEDDDYYLGEE